MKTNVQTTSLEAFYGIQSKLNNKEQEVLRALHEIQPASDRQLADRLRWELGSINGRRNSLAEKGVIEEAYKGKSVTGRTVIFWKVKEKNMEQTTLMDVPLRPPRRFM